MGTSGEKKRNGRPGAAPNAKPAPALDHKSHGLIVIDARGEIARVDDAIARLAGRTAKSLVGRPASSLIDGAFDHSSESIGLKRRDGAIVTLRAMVNDFAEFEVKAGPSTVIAACQQTALPGSNSDIARYIAETELISSLSADIHAGIRLKSVYENLANRLKKLIPLDRFVVVRMQSDGTVRTDFVHGVKVRGMGIGRIGQAGMWSARASRDGLVEVIEGGVISNWATRPPELAQLWDRFEKVGLKSYMEVAMGEPDHPIGYISVRSGEDAPYSKSDAEFFMRIGRALGPAIQSAELSHSLKTMAAREKAIASIGRIVSSTLDLNTVWEEFVRQLRRIVPADRIVIAYYDAGQKTMNDAHIWGVEVPGWEAGVVRKSMGTISATVINSGKGIIDDGLSTDGLTSPSHLAAGLRSGMYTPLIHQGEVIGTLNVKSKRPNAYSEKDLDLLRTLANQVAGAIGSSRMHVAALEAASSREAQIKLTAQNLVLERESAFKTNLISTVSHELRTPLTGVISMSDILHRNREGNLSEKQMQQIEVIRRSGAILLQVTNDLLAASAIDSGRLRLAIHDVEMKKLLRGLEEAIEPVLSLKRQRLVIDDSGPAMIKADRFRVEQIVANLLSNASKYSPEKSEIRLTVREKAGRLTIAVKDRGVGISAKDQVRLFDTYFRANDSMTMSQSGTGLGLPIVKALVEAHDGEVSVKSAPGKGSMFTVELPVNGPKAREASRSDKGDKAA